MRDDDLLILKPNLPNSNTLPIMAWPRPFFCTNFTARQLIWPSIYATLVMPGLTAGRPLSLIFRGQSRLSCYLFDEYGLEADRRLMRVHANELLSI